MLLDLLILKKKTFTDAFGAVSLGAIEENSSFKYSDIKDRVDHMMKECETMNDIRQFFEYNSDIQWSQKYCFYLTDLSLVSQ